MPITPFNNISSTTTQSNVKQTQRSLAMSMLRLSTGQRINSAADDAANMAISETMNAQLRSYAVAERNAMDGISMTQTADSGAGQISNILGRMREIAVQSGNGTLNDKDRANLNTEYSSLSSEINRIAGTTQFNGQKLLDGSTGNVQLQVSSENNNADQISVSEFGSPFTASGLGVDGTSVLTQGAASGAISSIDSAIQKVSSMREGFGAATNRLVNAADGLQVGRTQMASSLSRIRDTDYAEEASNSAKWQMMMNPGYALLAQANTSSKSVLGLLR
jgi:flagellin